MDLREYVVALSVVCRPSRTLDTLQLAFKASGSHMNNPGTGGRRRSGPVRSPVRGLSPSPEAGLTSASVPRWQANVEAPSSRLLLLALFLLLLRMVQGTPGTLGGAAQPSVCRRQSRLRSMGCPAHLSPVAECPGARPCAAGLPLLHHLQAPAPPGPPRRPVTRGWSRASCARLEMGSARGSR